MPRTTQEIIKLVEHNFIKFNEKRFTIFRLDKRYARKDFGGGKVIYKRKYITREQWEKTQQELYRPAKTLDKWRDIDIPRDIKKVEFDPLRIQYEFKLKSTREKQKTVFLAYTKEQAKRLDELLKKNLAPVQREKGKIKPVIDLSKPYKTQKIIDRKKLRQT